MEIPVNYLAVFLAMASSMVIGTVWYAKSVFGTQWAKLVGLSDEQMKQGSTRAIVVTVIVSLITAYVLAQMAYLANAYLQNSFLMDSVTVAFWLWAGLTAARFITHDAFEQRPRNLTAMNVAHEFVTLILMGLIIGWFGVPS